MARRIRAKLVPGLPARGMTGREIRSTRYVSQKSTRLAGEAADKAGLTWGDVADMPGREACGLLFPAQGEARDAYAEPDWGWARPGPRRDGVTSGLLWEEHRDEAARDGLVSRSHDAFCRGHEAFVAARGAANHLEHKPGQVMEVDRGGTPMWLTDEDTGESTRCRLFVATLSYSQHGYVEATPGMRQNTWLMCHARAWDFFGGVAAETVCDNPETGAASHPRGGEIVPDEVYEALGAHHVTAIMPTGMRKPRQRASVEGTCGKTATAMVARLRNRALRALAEPDAAIREALDATPFQKRGEAGRRCPGRPGAFLAPLPKAPFEACEWACGRKVAPNFHVSYERNYYSVPHVHVGAKADLRAGDSAVEVWVAGERVATHARLGPYERWPCRTDPAHMPPEFVHAEWDDARILRWAREIGPDTHAVVSRIFADVQIREQGHDPALAVPDLPERYGEASLEAACGHALERSEHPRCRLVRSALASGAAGDGGGDEGGPEDGYVRGAGYYGGGGE